MQEEKLNRRQFLKLLSISPLVFNSSWRRLNSRSVWMPAAQPDQPNIFFFLFDTLSAENISLFGYPRETMPNLARFAEQANVYHNHFSAGSWTPTGTASLLSGTYPWTHRSFSLYSKVLDSLADHNIFSLLNNRYHTQAYTQNPIALTILEQFKNDIENLIDLEDGGVLSMRPEGDLFDHDYSRGFWGENIVQGIWDSGGSSPFLSVLHQITYLTRYGWLKRKLEDEYPYSLSTVLPGIYVFLDEAVEWLKKQLDVTPMPTLSYYHFFPPHHPYSPKAEFSSLFADEWKPPEKPIHVFNNILDYDEMTELRRRYDQFIANVDYEFGIILDYLQDLGIMENSYIVFTTDHGESLERGTWGHTNELMYQPLVHIPLLIHKPGQTTREDFFTPTSSTDVFPTITQISGLDTPAWVEGEVLPGFRTTPVDIQRAIFSVDAKENSKFRPLTIATLAMVKWPYKLIHYMGYEKLPDKYELYNLEDDPQELLDLYPTGAPPAAEMKAELLSKLDEVNQRSLKQGAQ